MGKLFNGIAAGTVLGAAIGVALIPNMDRKTQKKIRRVCKKAACMIEDGCDDLRSKLK